MTGISPDSPLKMSGWIPMVMTATGFVYLAVAIMAAGGAAGH